jgi:hypothetical protein
MRTVQSGILVQTEWTNATQLCCSKWDVWPLKFKCLSKCQIFNEIRLKYFLISVVRLALRHYQCTTNQATLLQSCQYNSVLRDWSRAMFFISKTKIALGKVTPY